MSVIGIVVRATKWVLRGVEFEFVPTFKIILLFPFLLGAREYLNH